MRYTHTEDGRTCTPTDTGGWVIVLESGYPVDRCDRDHPHLMSGEMASEFMAGLRMETDERVLWGEGYDTIRTHPPEPVRPFTADMLREVANRIAAQPMSTPHTLILHPRDHGAVRVQMLRETEPDVNERRRQGERIAEGLNVPYWTLGVEGYKAPLHLRIKWLPGTIRRRVRQAVNQRAERLSFVHYVGRLPKRGADTWGWDLPSFDRHGQWWVHVGPWRVGRVPEEHQW